MKKLFSSITVAALLLIGCNADDQLFSDYRVFYKNAFVTNSGSILESSAFSDSIIQVTDDIAIINGSFEYASPNEIIRYGHCWTKGNTLPTINSDSSNCTMFETNVESGNSFKSSIYNLIHETDYSVRSFVITSNGTVGYNPIQTKFKTSIPHDEWFDNGTINPQSRADGISVTLVQGNDTVTYFGLGRNASNCYNDFYTINSSTGKIEQLRNFPGKSRWGAVAFALNYEDKESREKVRCIYVGLGCSDATGKGGYEKDFYVYDIQKQKWEQVKYENNGKIYSDLVFPGNERTGAIGFTLDDCGFVGLGSNALDACHQDFYIFLMDRDHNNFPNPSRGYFEQMTDNFDFGYRTGASVFVIQNQAYIVGGKSNYGTYFNETIQCSFVNPGRKDVPYYFTWTKKKPFPGNPRSFGATFSINGYGYYGTGEDENGLYSDFYKYDAYNDKWTQCADYKNGEYQDDPSDKTQSISPAVSRAFSLNVNDRGYIGGGYLGNNAGVKYSNFMWVYRP
ncbi:MAG: hypothetical protein MJ211_03870 [Bacteroidales bacterium]|nr:hypothetical protein [Bacteroidales bacterium]